MITVTLAGPSDILRLRCNNGYGRTWWRTHYVESNREWGYGPVKKTADLKTKLMAQFLMNYELLKTFLFWVSSGWIKSCGPVYNCCFYFLFFTVLYHLVWLEYIIFLCKRLQPRSITKPNRQSIIMDNSLIIRIICGIISSYSLMIANKTRASSWL